MSENNKNVFEELRAIAENTLRVYQSGLIQEDKRESNEATRESNEATRQTNENSRITKDEIRDIKISQIEDLIGEIGEAVDGILAIQANLIGGNL